MQNQSVVKFESNAMQEREKKIASTTIYLVSFKMGSNNYRQYKLGYTLTQTRVDALFG